MKNILIILHLLISVQLFGQSDSVQSEFKTYKNGFIYSEATMSKLENIVNSLNLKYKTCDLNKVFYSKKQAIGHAVRLDSNDAKQAKIDMDKNLPFDLFIAKYPNAQIDKNSLIIKYKYEKVTLFSQLNPNGYSFEIAQEISNIPYNKNVKGSWVYNYQEKSKYSKETIDAFYFPEEFKSVPLDKKYSRQIGYSDCLIDTNVTKFAKNAKSGSMIELPKNWQNLSQKKKEKLLKEMRSISVMGQCSMDSSPRNHAVNIALLSAEATNWEVFLQSHLDIMNDRFDRMTDGSYAYGQRKTYIKELEALNINVLDLLIGISLRVENSATNHYYGSIDRLGRAISESKDKVLFETQMLAMIEDEKLDDYNRLLVYFLFLNCDSYSQETTDKKMNTEKLALATSKLPKYLREKIN